MKDIRISSRAGEILSAEKLKIEVEFLPLFKKQIKVTKCEVFYNGSVQQPK